MYFVMYAAQQDKVSSTLQELKHESYNKLTSKFLRCLRRADAVVSYCRTFSGDVLFLTSGS